jgi:hypothetical protein
MSVPINNLGHCHLSRELSYLQLTLQIPVRDVLSVKYSCGNSQLRLAVENVETTLTLWGLSGFEFSGFSDTTGARGALASAPKYPWLHAYRDSDSLSNMSPK